LTADRSSAANVSVLAVDDHQAFREALRDLIAAAPGFVLVGLARSGEEALDGFDRISPQLVLMDVAMPGMGGIATARVIARDHPDVVVLLLSIDDPAVYLEADPVGDGVTSLRKQDLCPAELRRIWNRLR
jgi:DNA-binding NarL/FixJ family response regulator